MKRKIIHFIITSIMLFIMLHCSEEQPVENEKEAVPESSSVTVFREVLFYDGFGGTVDEPAPGGTIRISNSKYVSLLPSRFVEAIGNNLEIKVTVKAACDNYDRIGSVFLSLVEKGRFYDKVNIFSTIEIARFITPFMDKNKFPNEVPYSFEIKNIARLLADSDLSNKYDFWIELDIFGVPYAANTQVSGCQGRSDTFYGTLEFLTTDAPADEIKQIFIPIASKANFNNYGSTDLIGETMKSFDINIPSETNNAKLYLITSNHGANSGGEEYIRREHFIYFDGALLATYKPGGKSCEPFRHYNTQSNGIYGSEPRSDEDWTSWNNWCPGDKIPIRIYELGDLSSGDHTFKIEVPDAEFVGNQGNFPLTVYLQSDKL